MRLAGVFFGVAAITMPQLVTVSVAGGSPAPPTVLARFSTSPESSAEVVVSDGAANVVSPRDAEWVELSTPIHSPCRVAVGTSEACELHLLTIFLPFPGSGRVWVRESGRESRFRLLPPVPDAWGGGYALPPSRVDAVLAPAGERATLHVLAKPAELGGSRRETSAPAGVFRVSFVDGRGRPTIPERIVPEQPEKSSDPSEARRDAAWADFYASVGLDLGRDGRLTISPVPQEPVRFTAYGKSGVGVTFTARALRAGRDGVVDGGQIRLPSGSTLRVTLRPPRDAAGAPSRYRLELSLHRPSPGLEWPYERAARLHDLSPERPTSIAGLFPGDWHARLLGDGFRLSSQLLHLGEDETSTLEFEVTRESVSGRVEDVRSEAVPGALVDVSVPEGDSKPRGATTTADEEGRFSAEFFHGGGPVCVSAFAMNGRMPGSVTLDPRSEPTRDLTIVVPSAELTLLVVDEETEAPIDEARFDGTYVGSSGETPDIVVRSDDAGRIRLGGLDGEGEVTGLVKAEGYAVSDPVSVRLREGELAGSTTVRLRKASEIVGTVYSDRGPLQDAVVTGPLELAATEESWPPLVVRTDASGRFRLEASPGSTVTLAAWAPGYRLGLFRARAGSEQSVSLAPAGADSLLELVTEEGQPAVGIWPAVVWQGTRVPSFVTESAVSASGCAFGTTGKDGMLLFGGCLGPGEYLLRARFIRDGQLLERAAGVLTIPAPPTARLVVVREGERVLR